MTKFKVGDKVKLKKDTGDRSYANVNCFEEYEISRINNSTGKLQFTDLYTYHWYTPKDFELVSTPFQLEVGKTYIDGRGKKYKAIRLKMEVQGEAGSGIYHHNLDGSYGSLDDKFRLRPLPVEDWRALHYTNETASLGGESFQSEEAVKERFSNSPNFIKAVRVDA